MSAPLCTFPWHYLTITSHGYYQPCCYLAYGCNTPPETQEEVIGLFNSGAMQSLRAKLINNDLDGLYCKGCAARLQTVDDFPADAHMSNPAYRAHRKRLVEAYTQRQTDVPALPSLLELSVTRQCNLRCCMCHITEEDSFRDEPVVTTAHFLGLLQDVNMREVGLLRLLGGEIFFAPDGLEILDAVVSEGLEDTRLEVLTNGMLLDKFVHKVEKVANLKLTFSIDGYGEAYKSIRRGGNWERLLRNMQLVNTLREGRPNWEVRISSVIMRSSITSLDALVELADTFNYPIVFHKVLGHLWDENPFLFTALLDDIPWRASFDEAIARAERVAMPDVARTLRDYKQELEDCLTGTFSPANIDTQLFQECLQRLQALDQQRPVLLSGMNQQSYSILNADTIRALRLQAIIELDPKKIGHSYMGLPVQSLESLHETREAIVVCFGTTLYKQLRKLQEGGLVFSLLDMSLPAAVREQARDVCSRLDGRAVVIYGAGGHTVSLLDGVAPGELKAVAIADRNPSLHGTEMLGLPVIAPEGILQYAKDVLISSGAYEHQIQRALEETFGERLRIHTLYASPCWLGSGTAQDGNQT